MIKTIFFDIGGVLVDLHPERTESILSKATNLPVDVLWKVFPEDAHHEYERGRIDDHEFFNAVCQALPNASTLDEDTFWNAWMSMVGKLKPTAGWIPRLQASVPVWLLSNTNRYHVTHLLPNFPFYTAVDGTVFSYEVGFRKPESGIFQEALRRCRIAPEQALFIDDLEANVQAAIREGFHAIHFQSPEQLSQELIHMGYSIE